MADRMKVRPSAVLGVTDSWLAFCVDRATLTFVTGVEEDMEMATRRLPDNAKPAAHERARQRVLDQYLGIESAEQPQRFRSPTAR